MSLPDVGTTNCTFGNPEITMGSDDFQKRPYGFDPVQYLADGFACPDDVGAVLVGESKPIYAERLIAYAAMKLKTFGVNIKLICCQDFWNSGVIVAPDIVYDMAHVNDEYAAELTLKTYPYLTERDIVVRGNPGVKTVSVRESIREQYKELRTKYDVVYFFPGGGEPRTSSELAILRRSLENTPGRWCLVVGWHPKLVEEYGELWREAVRPFGSDVIEVSPGTGDEWGSTADVVVSGFSTVMTTAAYAGRRVIAIKTPEAIATLQERSMDEIPQVAMGWADCIDEPADLSCRGFIDEGAHKKLVPLDVQKAYESIVELLEEKK